MVQTNVVGRFFLIRGEKCHLVFRPYPTFLNREHKDKETNRT